MRFWKLPLALLFLCLALSAQNSRWGQLTIEARQLYEQGKYQQELPVAQDALRAAETMFGPESHQAAISLNEVAMVLHALDRWSDAEPFFRRAIALHQKLLGPDSTEVAAVLTNLGVLYIDMGRLTDARDLLTRGLAIREKMLKPDDPSIANSTGNLAAVSISQGLYPEAEALERRALAIDEKIKGPESADVATDLNNLGEACVGQARYKEAESLHIRALKIHLKMFGNENRAVASDLNDLGKIYQEEGRFPLAEATFRRALAIDEKAANGKGLTIADDLTKLANFLNTQARFPEAEPLYLRALSIDEKALGPEHPRVAEVIVNLATLYFSQGRFEASESAYSRALTIREKALGPNHPSVAQTLSSVARLRREQGRLVESEALYKRALAIDEKALGPQHPEVAKILKGLGLLYYDAVQMPLAAPLFQRALAIDEKSLGPGHPEVATDILNLADVYAAGNQPEQSGPMYERVISFDEKAFGPNNFRLSRPLLSLATLRHRGRKYAEAEQLGKRALSILETSMGPDNPETRGALANLAVTYYGWGRPDLASTYFDRDLSNLARQFETNSNYMNEKQWLQFRSTAPGAFPLFFSFVSDNQNRDPAAAAKMYDGLLWEKGLVASNAAALRAKILDSGDAQALGMFDKLTATRTQLAALATAPGDDAAQWRKQMAQLDQEASTIETDLVKRSAALAEAKASTHITWRDVQKTLKPDEAAVEYVRFQAHNGAGWMPAYAYAAVCLTSSAAPRTVFLGNAQRLESEPVAAYRADVARTRGISVAPVKNAPGPAEGGGTSAAYAAFWKPVEAALGSATRVYVSGDGILNQVPMGLFADSSGKLLLEKYDLRMVNSTKDLLRPQRNAGGKTAVVMGNPAFDLTETAQREALSKLNGGAPATASVASADASHATRGSERANPLPPLPATQAEAQAVAGALKNAGWQVSLYTGGMALEEVLGRARSPKVVHLATHGFFLENKGTPNTSASNARPTVRDPMLLSGLYFAGADRARAGERPAPGLANGVLTAFEASQLHLQDTELVVLSACETGLGQQANGEGVFGLRRGLQEAGAASILMSMWPVPDQETQELMTLFYQQWLGGLDTHEALRRAQLKERETVRQRYGRDLPYYWGAFVLVGR